MACVYPRKGRRKGEMTKRKGTRARSPLRFQHCRRPPPPTRTLPSSDHPLTATIFLSLTHTQHTKKGDAGPYAAVADAAADSAGSAWDAAVPTITQWAPARYVLAAARASKNLAEQAAADAAAAAGIVGGKYGGGKGAKGAKHAGEAGESGKKVSGVVGAGGAAGAGAGGGRGGGGGGAWRVCAWRRDGWVTAPSRRRWGLLLRPPRRGNPGECKRQRGWANSPPGDRAAAAAAAPHPRRPCRASAPGAWRPTAPPSPVAALIATPPCLGGGAQRDDKQPNPTHPLSSLSLYPLSQMKMHMKGEAEESGKVHMKKVR